MQETNIECLSCKHAVSVDAFLTACSNYWAAVNAVKFTCPHCRATTEARVEHARIWLGYTYAAGCAHFCGMVEIPVQGLDVGTSARNWWLDLTAGPGTSAESRD
jgi:predicted RNA-binding Zn-ribbon protein involved in translation (DUF1610 family)